MRGIFAILAGMFVLAAYIVSQADAQDTGQKVPTPPIDVSSFELVLENCISVNFPHLVSWFYLDNYSADDLLPGFTPLTEGEIDLFAFMRSPNYRVDGESTRMLWVTLNQKTDELFATLTWRLSAEDEVEQRSWVDLDGHDGWIAVSKEDFSRIYDEKFAETKGVGWAKSQCESHYFQIPAQ